MTHPLISIVSPVYLGEKMVNVLVERIEQSMEAITEDYEIILVNDASPDNSWAMITRECETDKRVKGVNLSRNFGQHYAITAGLHFASGEWVIVMDCDLQDRPEEIPRLWQKSQDGNWHIVYARRAQRQDTKLKKLSSTLFHKVFDWLSGMKTDKAIANFGIYSHQVIEAYNEMPEAARSFGTLINYLGFRHTTIDVQHSNRMEGKSSYNLHKLLKLAFDLMISNSNKPLRLAVESGFIIALIAFMLALYNVVAKLLGIIEVEGFTTTVFSIWFIGGLLLSMMGVLGLYIDKIFTQVKGRPLYVVMDKLNL